MKLVVPLIAAGLAIWACTVNTKTDKLACTTQADCGATGRVCESGYCVVDPNAKLDAAVDAAVCPAQCASCDFPTGTCSIAGTGGTVTCPTGWHCAITCGTAGACGDITCTGALSCAVTCSTEGACGNITCGDPSHATDCTVDCTAQGSGGGSSACGSLTCGTGKCQQTCQGSGACGSTSCANSCKCDVACNPLLGACGTMSCPVKANKNCTTSMLPGEPCNSAVFAQCHSCP